MNDNEIMRAYAALHAAIPETRYVRTYKDDLPEPLVIYDDTYGNWRADVWKDALQKDDRSSYTCEAIALCRCAALTWAGLAVRHGGNQFFGAEHVTAIGACQSRLLFWVMDGASDDLYLISICKRIHEAGGKP